ncbi:MAG: D-alanine--D-alanine ligase, partial [Longimicrobiales bacterium]|nr:D-alanine--D-alanine ligase [Longimicrobiales bacterium]
MRIAVLMGGTSEERDVSLASGTQVARALREAGHEVVAVDTSRGVLEPAEEQALLESDVEREAPDLETLDLLETGDTTALTRDFRVAEADLIFPALHGGTGEDGTLQALLDLAGLPYAGSGHVGCTLSMDKDITKRLLAGVDVPTPPWLVDPHPPEEVVEALGLPVIVKPASGGSTVGLTLVRAIEELDGAVELALRYDGPVMYEAYVEGREFTVGIVGDEALPVGEIIPQHELFDYECKYQPGMAQEIFPADIPEDLAARLQELALRTHRVLRMRDFSRVDFMVDDEGRPWCLEANALPGMTSNSLLPKAAKA